MRDYPSEEQLRRIAAWDGTDPIGLLDFKKFAGSARSKFISLLEAGLGTKTSFLLLCATRFSGLFGGRKVLEEGAKINANI